MPILGSHVPKKCEHITAQKIMSKELNTLLNVDTVQNVLTAIDSTHHSFPVLNHLGNVVGIIPRNFIITLLENRGFYMSGRKRRPRSPPIHRRLTSTDKVAFFANTPMSAHSHSPQTIYEESEMHRAESALEESDR